MSGAAEPSASGAEDPRADLRWGTLPALVADAARRHGDHEALVDGGRRLTYAELADEATTFARALMAWGLAPGDRVAVWAPNSAEWVVAALGILGAGGVLVTVNTRFKGAEAAYILATSGARLLCTVTGFLGTDYPALLEGEDTGGLEHTVLLAGRPGSPGPEELATFVGRAGAVAPAAAVARAEAVQPGDVCDLLFTSGTTGRPKGAAATHAQTLRAFGTWAAVAGLRPGDRYLVVNPFFHSFGYKAGLLTSLMVGATVFPEAVFDAGRVLERVAAERISVLPGPPALYQSLLDHPDLGHHDLSSLRLGVTGSSVIPVELVVALHERLGFETVLTAYGLTECGGVATMCRRGDPVELVATTSGRAVEGVEVVVADASGVPVPAGEPGEVLVRGYGVMPGYWEDPQATAEVIGPDGWLHTGDVGVMDGAGYLAITDRLKDMFVVGGFNAYPAEIEGVLRALPGVAQVAVIGVPDQRLGEVGCAWVVPGPGGPPSPEQLGRFARPRLANFKVPRFVVVADELPVNAAGKVLKRELRRRIEAGVAAPVPVPPG